ncbi:MAG: heavy metal translocating P-type ATPase [bacterium]
MKEVSYPVKGMTCAACVSRVEKILKKVEGIQDISVNLANEKAYFKINETTDINEAVDKLNEYGYILDIKTEKKADSVEETSNEFNKLKSDFIFALVLTIPIFVTSMTIDLFFMEKITPFFQENVNKILLLLTTPIIFIPAKRFYIAFWKNLKHFSADMNTLIAIGTGAAYGYSVLAVLFPHIISHHKMPHVYFESAAVIITLILLGKLLEGNAKEKTKSTIKKLLELKPKTAIILVNGKEIKTDLTDLKLNDVVVIKPGEKIAADGIITTGYSSIDESMITGESIPVEKTVGQKVIGGTINYSGTFTFQITTLGDNSVLGKIIKLVETAQGSKAPIQKLADKIASIFVPIVIVIALLTFLYWFFIGSDYSFSTALINFVSVLIIACPCALGLATPTAIMVGTGKGATLGILIKNGEVLETTNKITAIVLDKTGTLTEGKPEVVNFVSYYTNEEDLLKLVGSVENKSEHPLAKAIVKFINTKNIKFVTPDNFESKTGFGLTGVVETTNVIIGNEKFLNSLDISTNIFDEQISKLSSEGKTVILAAINSVCVALFALQDKPKSSSILAIKEFEELGIKTYMVTGDNKRSADFLAKQLNIKNYYAEALPDKKVEIIDMLQKEGKIVAMVGDGINDAPALAKANIGIAIGSGTDIAIESADIILVNNNILNVVKSITLSKKVLAAIKQNLFWAFVYNIIGIPLAALGMLNPMIGALAMSFSSVSVVTNSLRLRKAKI